MRLSKSKIRKMIVESLIKEGSKRDAQGIGILVREIAKSLVEKIKKVESLNSDVDSTTLIYLDKGFKLHHKIANDIETSFLELESEGSQILEKARLKTENKNTIIFKISDLKINVKFSPTDLGSGLPLALESTGGSFSPTVGHVNINIRVSKNFLPGSGKNYSSINSYIIDLQELLFHELHHAKQAHSLNPGGFNLNLPDNVDVNSLYKLKKEKEKETGIKKYAKEVQYVYELIKRTLLVTSKSKAKNYKDYLKKSADDFISKLKSISPYSDTFTLLKRDFLSFTPFGTYSMFKFNVFLIYYYFDQREIEAWAAGLMRRARLSGNNYYKNEKQKFKTMSAAEIKFYRKRKICHSFYQECVDSVRGINSAGSQQIKDMFENANSNIDLEHLLKKHKSLCTELLGLWFDYAIQKYGIFNEVFELEKLEIQKWEMSGGKEGINPHRSVERLMKEEYKFLQINF